MRKAAKLTLFRPTGSGILLALVLLWTTVPLRAAEVKRVALFPFIINAPERMDYVRQGVQDMLASRLSWEDRVVVIEAAQVKKAMEKESGPLDEAVVTALGKRLGVDVALWGSINVLGTTVSIDINCLSLALRQPLRKFYAQAKTMDEVIPRVNELADMINEKLFDRPRPAAVAAAPAVTAKEKEGTGQASPPPFFEGVDD